MEASEIIIQGSRVYLTPLQLDNIHTHFAWNNDPELNYYDSEIPHVEESFREFKQRFEKFLFHRTADQDFEIHTLEGTLIGVAYLSKVDLHNRHCLVGLTIGDREYWGKGYGREVLTLILRYAFDEMKLHRVAAEAFEYNDAWRRLIQWAGFEIEGAEREYLRRDDRFWDKENYSLLEQKYWQQTLREAIRT